jgi:predicted aspartyl protease
MIRYLYNRQVNPPAPFVHVTIRTANASKELSEYPAQIDPGADRTVIPWQAVEELGLDEIRRLPIGMVGGQILNMPTFLVQIQIRQLESLALEVLGDKEERFTLLGRDILNNFRLLLDGPQLALEIG